MSIPTEAIEKAAAEICDWDNQYAWKSLGAESPMKASYEDAAERALTAAAPHIQAAALRDFAHALTAMITVYAERTTEYDAGWVSGMTSAIAGLTARADQLEKGAP